MKRLGVIWEDALIRDRWRSLISEKSQALPWSSEEGVVVNELQ